MHLALAPLRAVIRALRVSATTPPLLLRALLAALLLLPMAILVLLMRIHAAVRGSLRVSAETSTGSRMVCRLPDLIQMYIWLFDVWEPDLTNFIQRRLRKGDTFVDIGANVGYFSMLAAKHVGESGYVVAVEASPSMFDALKENLALNPDLSNIHAINRAASDRACSIPFYSGPAHNLGLSSTVDHRKRELHVEAEVLAAPLGEILNEVQGIEIRRVRMIKIDVEGGEVAVLAGLLDMIEQCSEQMELLIELSPNWWADQQLTPRALLQPLFDRGFVPYLLGNNYWPWRYLWAGSVQPPQRMSMDDALLDTRVNRIDLVLSRSDSATL